MTKLINNPHIGQSLQDVILEEKSKSKEFDELYREQELINKKIYQDLCDQKDTTLL